MNKKITVNYLNVQVLNNFTTHNLFKNLANHVLEQNTLDNYIVSLIRFPRLFYIIKESIDNSAGMENIFSKLILYNVQ